MGLAPMSHVISGVQRAVTATLPGTFYVMFGDEDSSYSTPHPIYKIVNGVVTLISAGYNSMLMSTTPANGKLMSLNY